MTNPATGEIFSKNRYIPTGAVAIFPQSIWLKQSHKTKKKKRKTKRFPPEDLMREHGFSGGFFLSARYSGPLTAERNFL